MLQILKAKFTRQNIFDIAWIKFHVLAALPALTVLYVGWKFSSLFNYALHANPVLNAIILSALAFGVLLMQSLIWRSRSDYYRMKDILNRLERRDSPDFLFEDSKLARSEIGRLFAQLSYSSRGYLGGGAATAAENGLQAFSLSLEVRQELAQHLVGFMIAFGLLGTFIGILSALTEIGGVIEGFTHMGKEGMDQAFSSLVGELSKPLKGMGTAFSASMFGLIGSLCLGLTMIPVRHCNEKLLTTAREEIHLLIKQHGVEDVWVGAGLPSESYMSGFLADMIRQQKESLQLFHQGLEANVKVMQKVDALQSELGDLASMVGKQIGVAEQTNILLQDNPVTKQIAERFLAEIRVLASAATENSVNVANLLPALFSVTQKLSTFSDSLLQQRDQVHQTMQSTLESQSVIRYAVKSLAENESDVRANMLSEMSELRQFMMDFQPVASGVLPLIAEINSRLNDQLIALGNQQETIRFMTQTVTQSFVGIKTGISEMLLDAEKNRQLQLEMANQLKLAQRSAADFSDLVEAVNKVSESLSNNLAQSKVMLDEVRAMKKSVVSEVRLDIYELVNRYGQEKTKQQEQGNQTKRSKKQ